MKRLDTLCTSRFIHKNDKGSIYVIAGEKVVWWTYIAILFGDTISWPGAGSKWLGFIIPASATLQKTLTGYRSRQTRF